MSAPGNQPPSQPDDGFLVSSIMGGDESALRLIIRRYDRLIRYTIFRTARPQAERDPQWIDSVASASWAGFVQSIRKAGAQPPSNLSVYLIQLARNQCVSALRKNAAARRLPEGESAPGPEIQTEDDSNPLHVAEQFELLSVLSGLIADLDPQERSIVGQLDLITRRRWSEAAAALGLAESTLRSRWKKVRGGLEAGLRDKCGADFAPWPDSGDS